MLGDPDRGSRLCCVPATRVCTVRFPFQSLVRQRVPHPASPSLRSRCEPCCHAPVLGGLAESPACLHGVKMLT